MSSQIIRGNALNLPLADDSVDLVVTSPPYFGLRSYQDGGEHYDGQIGAEATPAEFVDALIAATREMVRVVKPSGSIWVNLGDKYSGAQAQNFGGESRAGASAKVWAQTNPKNTGIPNKSLIGIPWRYALRCIDDLGLILRAEVIWSKPNGLPESVTDRVRRSHEQWFHFTLNPRYYSAVDEVREAHVATVTGRDTSRWERGPGGVTRSLNAGATSVIDGDRPNSYATNPLGKLPGSVWTSDYGNGLGESTIGLVLKAVSEGQLTPEEGERILWAGRNDSGPRSTSLATAGGGSASSTGTDTAATGTLSRATDERTDSPTSSPRVRSPEGSTSTTSAATSGASTPTTSSPSPSLRTTPDDLASSSAQRDTTTTSATPTFDATASESAEPAWPTEHGSSDDAPPSVWVVPTEPLRVPDHLGIDHFAAFPTEWPRRIITGWSPRGVCVECGAGRRPVVSSVGLDMSRPQARRAHELATDAGLTEEHFDALLSVGTSDTGRGKATQSGTGKNTAEVYALADHARSVLGGYSREYLLRRPTGFTYVCDCPEPTAPTTPGVVLDPFGGTGTTALVADALGRHGISVDMSADYCRLATWRTTDPKQRAKAARKPFTPAAEQVDGQASLLELIEEAI